MMTSYMRQRLLLIAGWATAAVASGLVASGAVAVAGGQVTDRALHPLSAAEVAALPFVEPGSDTVSASDGAVAATGTTNDETAFTGPRPTIVQSPAGDDGAAAADPQRPADASGPFEPRPLSPILSPTLEADPAATPEIAAARSSEGSIYQLDGGSVAIGGSPDGLILLWATPKPGFVASYEYLSPTDLQVRFVGTVARSHLDAHWSDDGIVAYRLEGAQ